MRSRAMLPELSIAKMKSVPSLRPNCLNRRLSVIAAPGALNQARRVASIATLAAKAFIAVALTYLPSRALIERRPVRPRLAVEETSFEKPFSFFSWGSVALAAAGFSDGEFEPFRA